MGTVTAGRRRMPSGVVSAMMLSSGRIPAASRIFAGNAMSPRPDMESVAFMRLKLQKCRKTANENLYSQNVLRGTASPTLARDILD
jgi:hypothetical protein